jgi:recombination protein RecA
VIKSGDEIIGNRTRIKVVKNKVAPPFRSVEFDIMYGTGISKIGDLLDLAVEEKIINKAGAWFSYGEEKIGQGRENSKTYLEQNPELAKEVKHKLLVKRGLISDDTITEEKIPTVDEETGEIIDTPKKKKRKETSVNNDQFYRWGTLS